MLGCIFCRLGKSEAWSMDFETFFIKFYFASLIPPNNLYIGDLHLELGALYGCSFENSIYSIKCGNCDRKWMALFFFSDSSKFFIYFRHNSFKAYVAWPPSGDSLRSKSNLVRSITKILWDNTFFFFVVRTFWQASYSNIKKLCY